MQAHEQTILKNKAVLLEKRAKVESIRQKIKHIESNIHEQMTIIEKSEHMPDNTTELKNRRGKLLAESIANGIDNAGEIAAIDAEIAKVDKSDSLAHNAQKTAANRANEILNGLKSMLPPLEKDIDESLKTIRTVQDQLLQQLIMFKLEQYKILAFSLRDCFQDMAALDYLIYKNGVRHHSQTRPVFSQLLSIPSYLDMGRVHHSGAAVYMQTGQRVEPEIVTDLLKRLEDYGIEV